MFTRNSTNVVPDRKEYKTSVTYRGMKASTVKLARHVKNKVRRPFSSSSRGWCVPM